MSKHTKPSLGKRIFTFLGTVSLKLDSAHRSTDFARVPALAFGSRYAVKVRSRNNENFRYVTAWTSAGLSAKLRSRTQAREKMLAYLEGRLLGTI